MNTKTISALPLALTLAVLLPLAGCTDDVPSTDVGETGDTGTTTGDGDGDPTTGDGDGDGDPTTGDGDGDGDPTTGDGDGDPTTGDGDGDPVNLCEDGMQNQDETAIDCGGLICGPCDDGQTCLEGTDCASTNCEDGTCAPLGCQSDADCVDLVDQCNSGTCDLMTNECVVTPINEALDCDTGDLCTPGGLCTAGACVGTPTDCTGLDDVCNVGSCDPIDGSCVATPVNDGGDCGDLCVPGSMCMDGACMGGMPVDCSGMDDQCALGVCDPLDGSCIAEPANEGAPCNDGDSCSAAEACTAGECIDPDGGQLFFEDFSDNAAVWTFGTNWSQGVAIAGCGDPGTDHTPTMDNGIAGVVRGGCAPTTVNANFFCATSPVMDTSAMPSVFMSYWRDLWSDYIPYMKNKIEVWNGNAWVIVWESFGAPEVNDAMWTNFSYDLTAHKNAAMQIRFCYNVAAAGAFQRGSWNIDDVTVAPIACNGAD